MNGNKEKWMKLDKKIRKLGKVKKEWKKINGNKWKWIEISWNNYKREKGKKKKRK